MCALMPLGEVQARSPFNAPLETAVEGVSPIWCAYSSGLDAETPVGIGLGATEFASAADAQTALANHRQDAVNLGLPMSDISGLGDAAFWSGADEVGVEAVVRNTVVDANLKGEFPNPNLPSTSDAEKISAGTELVKAIIARLP